MNFCKTQTWVFTLVSWDPGHWCGKIMCLQLNRNAFWFGLWLAEKLRIVSQSQTQLCYSFNDQSLFDQWINFYPWFLFSFGSLLSIQSPWFRYFSVRELLQYDAKVMFAASQIIKVLPLRSNVARLNIVLRRNVDPSQLHYFAWASGSAAALLLFFLIKLLAIR